MQVRSKAASLALGGMLAVAFLAIAAAPASAQTEAPSTVTLKITPYEQPIKPLSALAILTATVGYQYMSAGSTALVASKVVLTVAESPPWAVVTISPSALLFPIKSPGAANSQVDAGTLDAKIIVTATADAPAFTAGNIKIKANAERNQPIAQSSTEDNTLITADYFSIIDAQVQQPIRIIGPQKGVDFPLTVTNFGNANTKVNFEVLDKSGGLEVPIPQPLTLEAKQTGGTKNAQTVTFSLQTPFRNGYMNQPGIVNLKLKSAYALDPTKKGEEVTLSVLVTTKGFYVPGPGPVFVLVGLALAVGIVSARKRADRA